MLLEQTDCSCPAPALRCPQQGHCFHTKQHQSTTSCSFFPPQIQNTNMCLYWSRRPPPGSPRSDAIRIAVPPHIPPPIRISAPQHALPYLYKPPPPLSGHYRSAPRVAIQSKLSSYIPNPSSSLVVAVNPQQHVLLNLLGRVSRSG